ncbi:MAG: phage tail tape measure protein [Succinivibrio sp.]|nr:phage tail tape measure protein [Succinivibrio sp.]
MVRLLIYIRVLCEKFRLEKQMSALGAVTKLTESQMAQLQERAVLLGRDTILSADQAAIGMANFVRAGYSVEEASKAMDAAGHVAVLTGKDFAEGSAFVLQALKSYGLGAEDAGRVSDVLANLMANSGLSAEKAAEKFQAVGPALRSMGVGLEESAGLIAAMDKLNLDSGKLQKMMVALKAPTTAQAKALNALGVSAARADGSQKDVLEIMGDLEKKLQGLPAATRDAKLTEIFSQRDMVAVKGILSSISNGELPDLISAMKKTGAAEKAAGKMTDNLWGDMQGLGSAIAYVAVRAFEALQPLMRSTVQVIANGVTWVGNFIKEHQTLAKVIGSVVLGVGSFLAVMGAANLGLGALMWTIGSVVGTVLKLATAFRTVIVAFKALSLVLISNPIGLIITLIGGLIAAGVLLWQNWDTVKQKASELWTWFSTSFPGIADFVSGTFDKIGAFINDVKGIFGELTDFVSNVFSGEWGKAWENVTNIFSQVFGMLASIAKAPLNAVISLVNKVFELIGGVNITLPDWIPGLGGKSFGFELPQIPMLAEGGIAQSPTLAMIGEGNEAEAVLPLSRLESLLKDGPKTSQTSVTEAPVTINFNPTINLQGQGGEVRQQVVQAMQVSSEQIKRVIRDYLAQQRRLSYA